MPDFHFQGTSGKTYKYFLAPEDVTTMQRQAGNYILAKGHVRNPIPVFIECTNGLRARIAEQMASDTWKIASDPYGFTLLYIHPDGDTVRSTRQAEYLDILDFYHPPMNRETPDAGDGT
jgi:hypothetical protein